MSEEKLKEAMVAAGFREELTKHGPKSYFHAVSSMMKGDRRARGASRTEIRQFVSAILARRKIDQAIVKLAKSVRKLLQRFVTYFFVARDGRLRFLKEFRDFFAISKLSKHVTFENVSKQPSPERILKLATQTQPILSFSKRSQLQWLRSRSERQLRLLLNPTREKFNPQLSNYDNAIALDHAVLLVRVFAKTPTQNHQKRLGLSVLVQQLRRTSNLARTLHSISKLAAN